MQTVDEWCSEIVNYRFDEDQEDPFTGAGHFTQVVWKGSRKVGGAIAKNKKDYKTYIVANYDPPGNIYDSNDIKDNVLRPSVVSQPITFPLHKAFEKPVNTQYIHFNYFVIIFKNDTY